MKSSIGLLLMCFFSTMPVAEAKPRLAEEISAHSPDGAFAMRVLRDGEADPDSRDGIQSVQLVAMPSRKVLATLFKDDEEAGSPSLLWAPDSRRCAFSSAHRRWTTTQVFERVGKGFREVELPELGMRTEWIDGKPRTFHVRNEYITPERWLKSGALVIDDDAIMRVWAHGQVEAEAENRLHELVLEPSRDGKTTIRSVQEARGAAGIGAVRSRAVPGKMRGPGVVPGRPDALEVGFELSCVSPDGKIAILVPDFGVVGQAARNFIVTTSLPLAPLGMLDVPRAFASGLRAAWNPTSTAAVVTVEAMTTPQAVLLLEFRDGHLVRQSDLLASLVALFRPDFRASKATPWLETERRSPFAIVDDDSWKWRWDGDRLEVECRASSQPDGNISDGARVWWAQLHGVWSVPEGRFIESKITRTYDKVMPDEKVPKWTQYPDDADAPAEEEAVDADEAKDAALTILRALDASFSITWKTELHELSFEERGKAPARLKSMKQLVAERDKTDLIVDDDALATLPLCFLSPDGEWLLVVFRGIGDVMLYTRSPEGWKVEATDESIEELRMKVGRFLMGEVGLEGAEATPEVTVSFVDWSTDSGRILLALDGNLQVPEGHPQAVDGGLTIRGWLCYYNLRTGKFELTDRLEAHNRWAVGRGNGQPDDWETQAPLHAEPLTPGALPSPAGTRFNAADHALNATYKLALGRLPAPEREAFRARQREWLAQRDLAASLHAVQNWSPFAEAARQEGAAIATEARVAELKAAGPLHQAP